MAHRSHYDDRERVRQYAAKQEFTAQRSPDDVRRGSRAGFEDVVFCSHRGRKQTSSQRRTIRATLSEYCRVSRFSLILLYNDIGTSRHLYYPEFIAFDHN